MGQHSNEFAPLKRQGFQVCDDAGGDGPEQAQICCNLSGNYEADNVETRSIRGEPTCRYGYSRSHYESEKFLCIHRYSKLLERENLRVAIINAVTYRDSKIITQESVVEYLDYDPSENQDWNWEDYK